MKDIIIPRSVRHVSYFLAGIYFVGHLYDAVSNSITLFSIPRAITQTLVILVLLSLYWILARTGRLKLQDQLGNILPVKKIGVYPLLFSLGASFLIWVPYLFETKAETPQYYGALQAKQKALLDPNLALYPIIEIGDSGANFVLWGENNHALFTFFKNKHLLVKKIDDQVKVSIQVQSRYNGLVAELIDNEWKVNPEAIFDRNYNKDSLEIRDKDGDVVLQIKALENKIQLQLKTYGDNGEAFAMVKSPSGKGGLFVRDIADVQAVVIDPIFKYPSDLHFGELRQLLPQR